MAAEALLSLRLPAAAQSPRTRREENANQRKLTQDWLTIFHGETLVAGLRKGPDEARKSRRKEQRTPDVRSMDADRMVYVSRKMKQRSH